MQFQMMLREHSQPPLVVWVDVVSEVNPHI
jgi:hypothetical protein